MVMVDIQRALESNTVLRSMTGLTIKQFDELAAIFTIEFERRRKAARRKRKPERAEGAGRKHHLETPEHKLFFALLYLRVYPTMEVAAFLFDAVPGSIHTWVHELLPVLEAALGTSLDLPKRKIRSVEEFLEDFPEAKRVVIDGTERPVRRPKAKERQKTQYSGKKKRHTVKNTLVVNARSKRVLILTKTVGGSTHDKTDLDRNGIVENIPPKIPIDVDLGYKGLEHAYEGINIPKRKPRTSELSDDDKAFNRKLASRRVVVEHEIGHVKRYNCVSHIYRNRRPQFEDRLMLVCCGLSNLARRVRPFGRA